MPLVARDDNQAAHNNGMHPTRDTAALIISKGLGGRVMPGVMRFHMGDSIQDIIRMLDGVTSVEDEAELAKLDGAVNGLLASDHPERGVRALLHVYERFPGKDGYGVFWSMLHGLESLPGYEEAVVESVGRQPSEFSLLMVNRMLNAGRTHVNGTDLFALLEEVARNPHYSSAIRKEAEDFVDWQRGRA